MWAVCITNRFFNCSSISPKAQVKNTVRSIIHTASLRREKRFDPASTIFLTPVVKSRNPRTMGLIKKHTKDRQRDWSPLRADEFLSEQRHEDKPMKSHPLNASMFLKQCSEILHLTSCTHHTIITPPYTQCVNNTNPSHITPCYGHSERWILQSD